MIYFKKINLTNPDKEQVEKAIRKLALKRTSSLDFASSGMITGTDKKFLGLEGKTQTRFTRIRYSIENLLPKFIISFSKSTGAESYKIRFSFRSSVIISFLTSTFLTTLVLSFNNPNGFEVLAILGLLYIIFILLSWLEYKLTLKAIDEVISNLKHNN